MQVGKQSGKSLCFLFSSFKWLILIFLHVYICRRGKGFLLIIVYPFPSDPPPPSPLHIPYLESASVLLNYWTRVLNTWNQRTIRLLMCTTSIYIYIWLLKYSIRLIIFWHKLIISSTFRSKNPTDMTDAARRNSTFIVSTIIKKGLN